MMLNSVQKKSEAAAGKYSDGKMFHIVLFDLSVLTETNQ